MVGQDKVSKAESRGSSDGPRVLIKGLDWVGMNRVFTGQWEERRTEFPDFHPGLVRHTL